MDKRRGSSRQYRSTGSGSHRGRNRRPKWQRVLMRHTPTIFLGVIVLAVVLGCVGGFHIIKGKKAEKSATAGKLSMEANATEADNPVDPVEEKRKQVDELIEKADFIAAGYDYEGAIKMLKESSHYDTTSELADKVAEYEQLDSQLVTYDQMNNITHIFFHSLIVDTSRAFDGEYTDDGYNLYMATVDEFNAILESMYQKGYVLVTPYDVAYEVTDDTGTHFTYGEIRLPEGKTPFIMSQDDLNYYGYMITSDDSPSEIPKFASADGDGFAHRLVIGDDGYPTCEYMDADGNVTTGDYDLVPCLETFIQKHPDFSYHGARAVLGITGYEGVYGYRTDPSYQDALGAEAYQKEVEGAKAVTQCLKEHGWIIASHSYGHPAYGNLSDEKVEADSDKWENYVQPVIGDTDILIYPYGSDIAGIEKYTFDNAKFAALYEDGYRYFFNVDSNYAWWQMGNDYIRGGRRNIDGYRMYHHPQMLEDLFDVNAIFDPARPTPVPTMG